MPAATPTATADAPQEKSGSGLTIPQIMGGALAAATAAILGSFLGVFGTIGGAAAASIVSTVGTALYQKSLERTQKAVQSRLVVTGKPGSKVAGAVSRVTGQQGAPDPRSAPAPGRPGAPMSPPVGTPRPGVPGRPGAPVPPTHRMPNGAVAPGRQQVGSPGPPGRPGAAGAPGGPGSPQQLRTGGRIVTARLGADGVPDQTRRLPGGGQNTPPRGPDGRILPADNATQVVGSDGRTVRGPFGPVPPPADQTAVMGGQPTAFLGTGPGDDPTQIAPAATPSRPKRTWKFWATLVGVTASIFAIGLLASFAVETVAGHPLSGGTSGTSVGSIFGQNTGTATTTASSTDDSGSEATSTTADDGSEQGAQETTTSRSAPTTTSRAQQQQQQQSGGAAQTSVQRYVDQLRGDSTGN